MLRKMRKMYLKNSTITITGGAIFSAISLLFALVLTPIVPRLPVWGIALIDPISIIWITCFLIFGITAGIICAFIGFVGLFFVDPFVPWGPLFKLAATLPLIIIPYLYIRLSTKSAGDGELGNMFSSGRFYLTATLPAVLVRVILMVIFNILFAYLIIPGFIEASGGLLVFILIVIGINIEQSVWDLLIPWLITYPTGIYHMHRFW
ncbi:MAG: hypothetical protein ACTSQY_03905 [Candidatus Odinarchaeia archaeon]